VYRWDAASPTSPVNPRRHHEWGDAIRVAAHEVASTPTSTARRTGPGHRRPVAVTLYQVGAVKPVEHYLYGVDGGMSDNPVGALGSGYRAFDVADPLAERLQNVRLVGKPLRGATS